MKAKRPVITTSDFYGATSSYEGFCTACLDFTTSGVEPDAHHYECESCGERTVYGAEDAYHLGFFYVSDGGKS